MTHPAATETDLADIEIVAADSRRRQTALLLSAVGLLGMLSIHLLERLYVISTTLSNLEQSAEAPSAAGTDSLVFSWTGWPAALLLASIVGIGYGLRASRKASTLHAALLARGKSLDSRCFGRRSSEGSASPRRPTTRSRWCARDRSGGGSS